MSDRIDPRQESASAEQAQRLTEEITSDDIKAAMQAQKAGLSTTAESAPLPGIEIFDSLDVKPAIDENFGVFDANGDGRLSRDELNKALVSGDSSNIEKAAAGLKRVFGIVDKNHDGFVSEPELKQYHESAQVYERTRERIDQFTDVAAEHFDDIDYTDDNNLSRRELLEFANDPSVKLSEANRQILREFAQGDYNLVSRLHDKKTGQVVYEAGENTVQTITQEDLDTAGYRLKSQTIEGQRMAAPGIVHDMYRSL